MRFFPSFVPIPANASRYTAGGTGVESVIVAAATNVRGVLIYTAYLYASNTALAADTGSLYANFGGVDHYLGHIRGPSREHRLPYPLLLPSGAKLAWTGSGNQIALAASYEVLP